MIFTFMFSVPPICLIDPQILGCFGLDLFQHFLEWFGIIFG